MKKFLFSILLLAGCSEPEIPREEKTYSLKYVVFYPGYTDTLESTNKTGYYWYSSDGTNYICDGPNSLNGYLYKSTAPFKILSYTSK